MTIPQHEQDRIRREAKVSEIVQDSKQLILMIKILPLDEYGEDDYCDELYHNLEQIYEAGATAENLRYQPLIEALELWQTFDARIHTSLKAAEFHTKGKAALEAIQQINQ